MASIPMRTNSRNFKLHLPLLEHPANWPTLSLGIALMFWFQVQDVVIDYLDPSVLLSTNTKAANLTDPSKPNSNSSSPNNSKTQNGAKSGFVNSPPSPETLAAAAQLIREAQAVIVGSEDLEAKCVQCGQNFRQSHNHDSACSFHCHVFCCELPEYEPCTRRRHRTRHHNDWKYR